VAFAKGVGSVEFAQPAGAAEKP
jgi:hypothetical protein